MFVLFPGRAPSGQPFGFGFRPGHVWQGEAFLKQLFTDVEITCIDGRQRPAKAVNTVGSVGHLGVSEQARSADPWPLVRAAIRSRSVSETSPAYQSTGYESRPVDDAVSPSITLTPAKADDNIANVTRWLTLLACDAIVIAVEVMGVAGLAGAHPGE